MARRGAKKRSNLIMLLILALIVGVCLSMGHWAKFDPQDIVKNSVLKNKSFSVEVKEVISPKYGVQAYLFFDNTNPIISVDFLFKKSGLAFDNQQQIGVSSMVASLLDQGAGKYNSRAFKEEILSRAIDISFKVDLDYIEGSLRCVREHKNKAYELLRLALSEPRFDADDVKRVKEQMLFALKKQQENPSTRLNLEFNQAIYGKHPYARNPIGDAKAIALISSDDLKNFVKSKFLKNNLVVGIAGDVSVEEAGELLDEVFGELKDGELKDIDNAELGLKNVDIKANVAHNVTAFAGKGVARLDEDFYALYVANHIFGASGLNSRLSKIARENEGLTYGVYTYLDLNDKANLIKGGFTTSAQNWPRMVEIVKEEWQKMGEFGVSQTELDEAKNYLISSYNLRFASISDISSMLSLMQNENLGQDFLEKRNSYVQKVKLEDVNRVVKDYFRGNNLMFVNLKDMGEK